MTSACRHRLVPDCYVVYRGGDFASEQVELPFRPGTKFSLEVTKPADSLAMDVKIVIEGSAEGLKGGIRCVGRGVFGCEAEEMRLKAANETALQSLRSQLNNFQAVLADGQSRFSSLQQQFEQLETNALVQNQGSLHEKQELETKINKVAAALEHDQNKMASQFDHLELRSEATTSSESSESD
ncbi:hypothetical protein M3Y99_00157900 [Aphelenchoides fujianensis]|nr:hypothetical protein M3Y99_00157900 [Aphelenchoides fujianensis]